MTIPAGSPPPHRTQIPNIVDDLGLDPYERALYVHYKRVCGENQGAYCYETVKTTAQKIKMSTGQVSEARKQLANRGLILVQEGRPVIVTVANIWELNTAFYQLEHRPDVDGWTVERVKLWLCDMSTDVHTVNVSSHNDSDLRSPDETILTEGNKSVTNVHRVNVNSPDEHSLTDNDNMSSYVHTVKQRIDSESKESNPSKESKALSPKQHVFLALAELCRIDLKVSTDKQQGQLGQASAVLCKSIADVDLFKTKFNVYWAKIDWRGKQGQAPTPAQVREVYGDYCHWLENGEIIPVHSQNGRVKGPEPYLDETALKLSAAIKSKARPRPTKG